MLIQLININQGYESTLSKLVVDGVWNKRYVLQDTDRGLTSDMSLDQIAALKVWGRTAICTGRYRVTDRRSAHFGQNMPHIEDVPGFSEIMLHWGNLITQTDGCPLTGINPDQDKQNYWRVWSSKVTFAPIYAAIKAAIAKKEPVWCEVSRLYVVDPKGVVITTRPKLVAHS